MYKNLTKDSEREEIRDWVLQISLDQKVNQELDTRQCECGKLVYAASLDCHSCSKKLDACCISGYPIINSVKCTNCGKAANKEDWNKFVLSEKVLIANLALSMV
jgi:intraflagellar transport protein 172